MDAINYFKNKARMTDRCEIDCAECPLDRRNTGETLTCYGFECEYPDKAIAIVEQWTKEHPVKTRQSEFLKMFPDPFILNGHIDICPKDVDGMLRKEGECQSTCNCDDCKDRYWLEEIE